MASHIVLTSHPRGPGAQAMPPVRWGAPSVAERGEREARLVVRGQSEPSLELTSLVASIVRAGLRSIPGTHAEVSLTACAALGDACDVLRVRW